MPKGKELKHVCINNGEDDATKARILNSTRRCWVGVEDDIKLWVQENWRKWEEEEPKWLDANMRARTPIE